jgi:non-specific serine/threonine protein kinase
LLRYEAVQLFVERARVVEPGFTPGERNAPALSEVCSRLDGIPLALELAAARARVLTVEQIAARLDDRFRLLTGGSRTALRRQQTLRATVDWSHDLLSEPERALLRRLSVFAGGWTLEAAEAVCAADPVASEDVLDLLTGLVDKSLVVAEGQDSGERYRLLETIRQYGWGKLQEADEAALLRTRHAEWFMALAVRAEPALSRPDQGPWLERLEQEHDNLRAAIQWSAESGEVEVGLRLGGALWRFWAVHGHLREGRERLAALLALPEPGAPSAPPTAARAKALHGAGTLALRQGDYAAARPALEESLAIRRELGDRPGIAASLNNLGYVVRAQGDYAAASALFEQSLAIKRERGDRQGIAHSHQNLGETAHLQGDYALARDRYEESLAISRESKDGWDIASSLCNLGYLSLDLGDAGAARSQFGESLAIWRGFRSPSGIALALEGLAGVAAARGAAARAMRLTGAAAALRAPIGVPIPPLEQGRLARWLQVARQALSDDAAAALRAEGQAMTPEQATAYALEEAPEQHAVAPTGSVDAADNRPA